MALKPIETQSNAQDQLNKANQEKWAKDHPEWKVNDTFYGTEEDYLKAKQEYENKVSEATKAAKTKQAERKAEVDKANSEINNAIYGQGSGYTLAQMTESVGGVEMAAILGNAEEVKKRQHLLNPEDYEDERKKPNTGKPPNNEDAFPVDLKIEEMEVHKPDVKIHEITTHVHGEPAAKAALYIGDTAEKRLIHLENNMATIMRYLFRLGARMHINCVYWGGTSPFAKYKTIRCLNHDRVAEGQNVQIDQCLNCTRFEPVFGQCYELMNDLGANVAAILDDNQMAYTDIEEYVKMDRIEKFVKEHEDGQIDLTKVMTRSVESDPEFKNGGLVAWGEGVSMDWTPVAKEDQRCHINWRQSINDDGSNLARLASFPKDEVQLMPTIGGKALSENAILKNYKSMEANSNPTLEPWISAGKAIQSNPDVARTKLLQCKDELKDACKGMSVDKLLMFCIAYHTGDSIKQAISKYGNFKGTVGDNPALIVSAMSCGVNAINGDGNKILSLEKLIEKIVKEAQEAAKKDNGGKSD